VHWLEHEVDHSPVSSTEVRNEWICTSAAPICLHSVDRDRLSVLDLLGCGPDDSGTRAATRGRSKRFLFRLGLPDGLWGASELSFNILTPNVNYS